MKTGYVDARQESFLGRNELFQFVTGALLAKKNACITK